MPRWRAAGLVVVGGLLSIVLTTLHPAGARQASEGAASQGDIDRGQQLFAPGCSSCHGLRAEGTPRGPSLLGVGAASVDFWVSTGRMPLKTSGTRQAVRKPPAYDRRQIDD